MVMVANKAVVELPKLKVGIYDGGEVRNVVDVVDPRIAVCRELADLGFDARPLTEFGGDSSGNVQMPLSV